MFIVGIFDTPEEAAKARKEPYELLGLEYVCKSEFKEEKENLK